MAAGYRSAIIGCGRIASTIEDELRDLPGWQPLPYSHAGAYRSASGVDLVAAADPDPVAGRAFGKRWSIDALFGDATEMLRDIRPDIVSIATPTRHHAPLLHAAIEHGVKGIVLEKPVSITLAEADEMIARAEAADVAVAINHTRSYDPLYQRAAALVRDGFIGTPHTAFATWGEGWSFGGSHLFDLFRELFGGHVTHVFCDGESGSDPGGRAYIAYDCGVSAFVSGPRQPLAPLDVELIGTEGRVRMGAFTMQLFRADSWRGHAVPVEWPFFGRMEMRSAMTQLVEDVVAALATGERVRTGLREGRAALEIAVALNESARRGVPVQLPIEDASLGVESL